MPLWRLPVKSAMGQTTQRRRPCPSGRRHEVPCAPPAAMRPPTPPAPEVVGGAGAGSAQRESRVPPRGGESTRETHRGDRHPVCLPEGGVAVPVVPSLVSVSDGDGRPALLAPRAHLQKVFVTPMAGLRLGRSRSMRCTSPPVPMPAPVPNTRCPLQSRGGGGDREDHRHMPMRAMPVSN